MTDPIRVSCCGEIVSATPLKKLPNGNWLMTACSKHRFERFDIGHLIEVTPKELIDPLPEMKDAIE